MVGVVKDFWEPQKMEFLWVWLKTHPKHNQVNGLVFKVKPRTLATSYIHNQPGRRLRTWMFGCFPLEDH